MPRYIDADALIEDIKRIYCTDCNNYNEIRCRACGTDDALRMIDDAPTADVVPKAEAEKWYGEYHHVKDELQRERMYHRETEKLADKYFIECKRLEEQLDAAIAGQETLQRYLLPKDPRKEGLSDWFCPSCGVQIKYDSLNMPIEHAPKHCSECGQRLLWNPKGG